MAQVANESAASLSSVPQSPTTQTNSCNQVPIDVDVESPNEVLPLALGPMSRHRSTVWADFVRKEVDGKITWQCKHCGKLLVGGAKAGTSHLRDHLKSCIRKRSKDLRQCLLKEFLRGNTKNQP